MQPDWGFYFHAARYENALGHPRLEINLVSQPTESHYDPERVDIPIIGADGTIENLTVSAGWTGNANHRVSLGRIVMEDRVGKQVTAFSFGGALEIEDKGEYTNCVITSEAPILDLVEPEDEITGLVSEIESQLARQRIRWSRYENRFEQLLNETAPLRLCAAALRSARETFKQLWEETRRSNVQTRLALVEESMANMRQQGEWPGDAPTLDELLAPPDNLQA